MYWPANSPLYGVLRWAARGERVITRIRLTDEDARPSGWPVDY